MIANAFEIFSIHCLTVAILIKVTSSLSCHARKCPWPNPPKHLHSIISATLENENWLGISKLMIDKF